MVTEITFHGDVSPLSSYGIVAAQTVKELERRGVIVYLPRQTDDAEYRRSIEQRAPELVPILARTPKQTPWGIVHSTPKDLLSLTTPRKLLWTMLETTRMPALWALAANTADGVIVPSRGMIPFFQASGVTKPLFVAPDPIDVSAFTYVDRPERDTFTFGTFGTLTARKCPIEIIAAWRKAFPTDQGVKLVLKSRNGEWGLSRRTRLVCADPRITLIGEDYTPSQLARLCHDADAGIWLSRGEGSGNCAPQAAATGLGCLVGDHSGQAEWADPACFFIVGLDPKRPTLPAQGVHAPWGEFQNPDMDQAVETLRYMAEHRISVRERGKAAAAHIRANFTVKQTVDSILSTIEALS